MNLCLQAPKRSKERLLKLASQSKYPLTEEQTRKMRHIYTMEYYSSIKKNVVMPFVAKWMDLEVIMLSEVSQRKRNSI